MASEFMIPVKLEDLLQNKFDNYIVSDAGLITIDRIKECKSAILERDVYFILEYFDLLFSVLYNMDKIGFDVLHECFRDVILESMKRLYLMLEVKLNEDMAEDSRLKLLNCLKMITFIYVNFSKLFREKINKEYQLIIEKGGRKNEKFGRHVERYGFDVETSERLGFECLQRSFMCPLYKLWKPAVVDTDFVNLVGSCCFATMENPLITSSKFKAKRDLVYGILFLLMKSYDYVFVFRTMVLQMIKNHEHLTGLLSELVMNFSKELNCKSLIKELCLLIVEFNDSLLETDQIHDNASIRLLANFIIEIAECDVELLLPSVDVLIPTLNTDPYNMRICTLTVLAEILIQSFKTKTLTDDLKQIREEYITYLMDHIADVNYYVRSKVLKLWQKMWKNFCIPKQNIIPLVESITERLHDKSVQVVKFTLQLLQSILKSNPFGPTLEQLKIEKELLRLRDELVILEIKFEEERLKLEEEWEKLNPHIMSFLHKKLDTDKWQSSDVTYVKTELPDKFNKVREYLPQFKFEEAYDIVMNIENSFPDMFEENVILSEIDRTGYICWIFHFIWVDDWELHLKDLSGLQEQKLTVLGNRKRAEINNFKFYITYMEEWLKFAEIFTNTLESVWELAKKESVYESVECIQFIVISKQFCLTGVEECVRNFLILIHSKESAIRDCVMNAFVTLFLEHAETTPNEVAQQLIDFMKTLNIEQMIAFKNIIKECVQSNLIQENVIQGLWDIYTKKIAIRNEDDRISALNILAMIYTNPKLLIPKLDLLLQKSIQCKNPNSLLVSSTCRLMKQLSKIKTELDTTIRVPAECQLIKCLTSLVQEQFSNSSNAHYTEMALDIIELIYAISLSPDVVCESLLKYLYNEVNPEGTTSQIQVLDEILARFLMIIGHVAYSHWKYMKGDISKALKYQNAVLMAEAEGCAPSSSLSKNDYIKKIMNNAEILTRADKKTEQIIRGVCDNELLHRHYVLLPQLSSLVMNTWTRSDVAVYVRCAAALAVSKFMIISRAFCSENIEKFVNMMNTCTDESIKLNMLQGFGDICCLYPNVVEPYSSALYNRLRDNSVNCRYSALLIVSYLVVNEMVKVSGHMTDVSLCLVDDDSQIKNLAIRLFDELSRKDNTIYNVLPEIISQLSDPGDNRISEEKFRFILKTLTDFIKDKHMESLTEKLCQRLRTTTDQRQNADISYCLTLMHYTDRSIQKLIDYIPYYADKLSDVEVHTNFLTIINDCNKSAKLNKENIDELSRKIDAVLTKRNVDLEDDLNVMTSFKTPSKSKPVEAPKSARRKHPTESK